MFHADLQTTINRMHEPARSSPYETFLPNAANLSIAGYLGMLVDLARGEDTLL